MRVSLILSILILIDYSSQGGKFSILHEGKDFLITFFIPKPGKLKNRIQHQFPENAKFFCDLRYGARSKTVPSSVHKLTPGDIDIISAMGDSLTVANGGLATNAFQVNNEYRGISWSIGGQKSWRNFLTLPNIIKVYNSNLYGYTVNEYSIEKFVGLNAAIRGLLTAEMIERAEYLIKKMKNDKKVDVKNHWKLITYMVGANDYCSDICYSDDQEKLINNGADNLIRVLRLFKENLPRTLVNVVLPPDVSALTKVTNRNLQCKIFNYLECPCFFNIFLKEYSDRSIQTIRLWNQRISDVVNMPEFHDTDDFEVNVHPFLDRLVIPTLPNGNTDLSYLTEDCFHISQKGHALFANYLWNSMLTPEKNRVHTFGKLNFEEFNCPSASMPYLVTNKNS